MNPYVACVMAAAKTWAAYYKWGGHENFRAFHMKIARGHIETYGAIYRVQRRTELKFNQYKNSSQS